MSDALAHGPLSGLRVLEVTDEKGQFCGKLLADLGADVIKIEPPGGDHCRQVGPFLDDVPHPDRSLYFWYYNTSKRGITLAIDTAAGKELFRRLASDADVIVESQAPGYMAGLGLGYDALAELRPSLIMCSLTPFGQSGPWRDYRTTELLHMAAGGQMASCGYDESDVPGHEPIAPGGGNAWHMGAHYAYMGIMAALVHRSVSGEGQYIDASIHDACALTTEAAVPIYIYRDEMVNRHTGRHHDVNTPARTQFQGADGYYVCALVSNQLSPAYVKRLHAMLDEFGMAGDLGDPRYEDAKFVQERAGYIVDTLVADFIASKPAEDIYHIAQSRGFTWAAVRAAEELLDDEHLADRAFWKTVSHPELERSFTYPGEAAIYSDSPWQIRSRAPLVGEHNQSVYGDELGMDLVKLQALTQDEVI
jgi:benzylsuccinate CoA-transferase BbsE subunit